MATTTNYSWTTPDDTDLVKDGAEAIRTLGSAIDTTMYNPTHNTITVTGTSTLAGMTCTGGTASSNFKTGSRTISTTENVEGTYMGTTILSANRSGSTPFYINRASGTTSASVIQFYRNGSDAGTINASTSAAPTFAAPSDYRLKANVTPLEDAAERIKNSAVYTYHFIADEEQTLRYGFLAHEASEIMEDLVIGEKDAVDDDGNPVYQMVQETRLIPILAAALKDALLKIDDLETRLSAVEAK